MTAELLRVKDVAALWSVPKSTLYSWHRKGVGPPAFYLHGRVLVYRRTDIDAWVEAQQAAAAS